MLEEIKLEDFQDTGLLWMINQQLHLFGMALVIEYDEESKVNRMYPAKCKFRGFSEESNTNGYRKVTKYMLNNSEELIKDCE